MLVNIVHCSSLLQIDLSAESTQVDDLFTVLTTSVDPDLDLHLRDQERSSFYVLCNGRRLTDDTGLEAGKTYHIVPRLPGGKGGFGSMLRAIGAQIEKTTSREACRDLSGRRMRDINNEKKLKEWLAKEAEREREREQRRQERLARQLATPQHKFDDPEYHEQKTKVQDDLQEALSTGLKRTHRKHENGPSSSKKRKTVAKPSSSSAEWLGMDLDSDDLDSSSDNEASPGDPEPQSSDNLRHEAPVDTNSENNSSDSVSSSSSPHAISNDKVEAGICQTNTSKINTETDIEHQQGLGSAEQVSNSDDKRSKNEMCDNVKDDEPIDLDQFDSSDELAQLGMERLKNALMSRGLKCGGTCQERSERLFSVKGLTPDQIDPSLIAKSKGKGKRTK